MAVARSRIDDTILRYASSESAEQIAQRLATDAATAISAAAVAQRRTELLTAPPLLSAVEEERALVLQLKSILAELSEQHLSLDNAKVQVQVLREIGNRLDKRAANSQESLDTYSANVGRQLGQVVDGALGFIRGALREEIDADRWDELVLQAMDYARREIGRKVIEN